MKSSRIIAYIVLAGLLALAHDARAAQPRKFPGDSRGGYGFHGFFQPLSRAEVGSETWKGKLTGGFGLFGEYLPLPNLALGIEGTMAFPKVERKAGGENPGKCTTCNQDVLLQLLARIKVPIQLQKNTSFFPIVHLGYSFYHHDNSQGDRDFHGLGFGGGLGVEIYTYASAVSLEVRYVLHHTPDLASSGEFTSHGLIILLSFRLL